MTRRAGLASVAVAGCLIVAACGEGSAGGAATLGEAAPREIEAPNEIELGEAAPREIEAPNEIERSPAPSVASGANDGASGADTTPETSATVAATDMTTTTEAPLIPRCVDDLELRAAVALLVWPAAEPSQWDAAVAAVRDHHVGGVILMRPTGWDADEIRTRLGSLESLSRHGLVIATDEEGGDVQRLRVLDELDSQRQVSSDLGDDLQQVRTLIADHGRLVRDVGVDMVFGPVVDVEPESGDVPLAPSRFFEGGPDEVGQLAAAYADGWADAGLFSTLKHFPGHGAASGDTHDVDGVTPSIDALRDRDLVPYTALGERVRAGDVAVMIGHLTVPGLTEGRPATQSRPAVELLRSLPGYDDALLVTDALGMAAVGLAEPEAAVAALAAGVDIALFTQTSQTGPVIEALVDAVERGEIDESSIRDSAARVMSLLERDGHSCDSPSLPGAGS